MKYFAIILLLAVALTATATTYYFDSAPFTTYGEFNPTPLNTWTDSGHTAKQLNPSQSIRFASSSATVVINSFVSSAAARTYTLYQDGVIITNYSLPTTPDSTVIPITLGTGLDTGSVHEYEIACMVPIQSGIGNWYDVSLTLDNLASVPHPNRFVWGWYGDSITGVTSSHMTDISSPAITNVVYADSWQVCHSIGAAMIISGVAGGKVNTTGRDSTGNIPTNVNGVAVCYGVNDLPDLPTGTNAFQLAYGTMLTNIFNRIGNTKPVLCFQPWPVSSDSSRALAGAAGVCISNEVVKTGRTNVVYVNTDNYYPITTDVLPDGTHPNAYGYTLKAASELPVFQTYTPGYVAPPATTYYMPFRR